MAELYTDVNKITADLQLKAEKDLSNITASAKSQIAGYGMPSSNYVDLTLGASGATYTAPANGYFEFGSGASGVIQLINQTKDIGMTSITQTLGARAFVSASTGDIIVCNYTTTPTTKKFIYAEGENE